jgi:hypothetical protein
MTKRYKEVIIYFLNTLFLSFIMVKTMSFIFENYKVTFCYLWLCGFVLLFSITFLIRNLIKESVNYLYDKRHSKKY